MDWERIIEYLNKVEKEKSNQSLVPVVYESEVIEWIEEKADRIARRIINHRPLYRVLSRLVSEDEFHRWKHPMFLRIIEKFTRHYIERFMEKVKEAKYSDIVVVRVDVGKLFSRNRRFGDLTPLERSEFKEIISEELEKAIEDRLFSSKREYYGKELGLYEDGYEDDDFDFYKKFLYKGYK
jgi:hypothetical protein